MSKRASASATPKNSPRATPTSFAPSAQLLRAVAYELVKNKKDYRAWRREFPDAPFRITDRYQAALLRQLDGNIPPVPAGFNVLMAIFVRPKAMEIKGAAGKVIWLPDSSRDEDIYQGRVGLVLATGPQAYRDDKVRDFGGEPWVMPGDWAIYPALENAASRFSYGGITWTGVNDDKITAIVADPMLVT